MVNLSEREGVSLRAVLWEECSVMHCRAQALITRQHWVTSPQNLERI